ncbi:kinase-like domain-containing protein [Melanogaster broomeanus]|nr:kinase-like domain-containing protein [Melanogaster broomeanus]
MGTWPGTGTGIGPDTHGFTRAVAYLQDVHSVDYIHRDLKPSNILIGREPNAHHIYLIDFSHATEYRHPKTRLHHSFRNNQCFIGTPTFAPINSHLGFEQGRRDDLESLAYIMIYFFHGRLPWSDGPNDIILEQKQNVYQLLPDIPDEMKSLLHYARNLDYSSKPDYDYLRKLMRALRACCQDPGAAPDWMPWTAGDHADSLIKPTMTAHCMKRPQCRNDTSPYTSYLEAIFLVPQLLLVCQTQVSIYAAVLAFVNNEWSTPFHHKDIRDSRLGC